MIALKITWLHLSVLLIFLAFSVLMLVVTIVAYSRLSGNTGLDMSKMQQLRHDSVYKQAGLNESRQ